MIVVVKTGLQDREVKNLIEWIEQKNIKVKATEGENKTILGLVGDTAGLDIDAVKSFGIVDYVMRVQEPYKQASRKFKPTDTVIDIGGIKLGGGNFQVIAGPCSVESETQMLTIAESVSRCGARLLRGGAFKPRTSPYAFQGLQSNGIDILLKAREKTGMPIVTEIMSVEHLPLFENVDVVQVGARNMQNFELLKALGKTQKVILLKRGLSSTIDELLMSAEYILAGGNSNVILCERGIRTFETSTRNTLDISAIGVLKKKTHLPVVIDPSHSAGYSEYVEGLSLAAAAAGADGLIIEVHNDPKNALCDGAQSLTPEAFDVLMQKLNPMRTLLSKLNVQLSEEGDAPAFEILPHTPKAGEKVACQGVKGAYSDICAGEIFDRPEISYFKSFESVFEAVSGGACRYGVLPIENTIAGSVFEVYDLLHRFDLKIVREHVLKISHSLLCVEPIELSAVKRVYSHPQALYQCKEFLKSLGAQCVETENTATAAEFVAKSKEPGCCAIGAKVNCRLYGLQELAADIQDNDQNFTRFIAVSKRGEVQEKADKMTLLVTLEHKQNALMNLLNLFSLENINMLKLESRPIPGKKFEMMFYLDIEGKLTDKNISRMLARIGKVTNSAKVLGCYESDRH